jgi:hypothetical protein
MKYLLCCILLYGAIGVFAADVDVIISPKLDINKYNKIDIFYEEEKKDQSDDIDVSAFYTAIEAEFMRLGFNVIDRNRINQIMTEQQITSPNDILKLGGILGANVIVSFKYNGKGGFTHGAQMRMIDIETSMLLMNANFTTAGRKTPGEVAKIFFKEITRNLKK